MAKAAYELGDSHAYWSKCIGQWERSGQSQRAFCAGQGLALSTFQWWRTRLKRAALAAPTPSFVPFSLIEPTQAVVHIELRSGTRVRLEGEAALRAVDALVGRLK
jgi:hypothetical protein